MKNRIITSVLTCVILLISVQSLSAQDDQLLFRKRILSSTWNSFLYGDAVVVIGEMKGAAAVGIPVIAAGAGALVPLLTNESRPVTTNMLQLTNHGQTIGWFDGFAFSALIFGNDFFDSNKYKVTLGLGAATSIGLGILGKSLGKNKDWSEGQVALYRHYGWVGPMITSFTAMTFADDPRVYGGAFLLGGAGGYLLGDVVNNWNEFTRGEVTATRTLTIMNGILGGCILADIQDYAKTDELYFKGAEFLIPAAGIAAGTAIGHFWLKDTKLTPRQGMTTVYAAGGGAILGLGLALVVNSEAPTLWYSIPYATSLGAYAFAVEKMRKKNSSIGFRSDDKMSNWDFAFMPYNIMLNNKIEKAGGYLNNGRTVGMQPLFAATFTF